MCLITFAYKSHPDYSLILVGNRDEFYHRPTRSAEFWTQEHHPDILAGKDLLGQGTWLGIHQSGKWAALTNYRDLTNIKPSAPSRGSLVMNFLTSNLSVKDYAHLVTKDRHDYNGYNLLMGDFKDILHYSNHSQTITLLSPGIHSLSNELMNSPWTKSEKTKHLLQELILNDQISNESLIHIMQDEVKAELEDLPNTGLSLKMELALSSPFIITPEYGTRCTTIIKINKNGQISFTERSYIEGTQKTAEEINWQWNAFTSS